MDLKLREVYNIGVKRFELVNVRNEETMRQRIQYDQEMPPMPWRDGVAEEEEDLVCGLPQPITNKHSVVEIRQPPFFLAAQPICLRLRFCELRLPWI